MSSVLMRLHQIRILSIGLALLAPMLVDAAPQGDAVVGRYHFLGGNQLVANPNASKLKQIGAMPATVNFRDRVTKKVAVELANSLGKQLNPSGTNEAVLLQPLLDDLIGCESVGFFGGRSDAPMAFVLAIRVSPNQAKVWQENLARLVGAPAEPIKVEGFGGQAWKTAAMRVIPAKEWLVVGRGEDLLSQQNELLANLSKQGRPCAGLVTNWFEADADWPRLASWLPLRSCPFKLARTQIALSSKPDGISTTVRVRYPEAIQWKSKAWNIPTELVRDPLVSFTAAQNLAPFLTPSPSFAKLKLNPWNEEFFIWANAAGIPFQTYGAIPVHGATNLARDLAVQLPEVFNPTLKELKAGSFTALTNNQGISWNQMPVPPVMRPVSEKAGEFIKVEFFAPPPLKTTQPAPAELLKQVTGVSNLVYYDWELTEKRLEQWRQLAPVMSILKPVLDEHMDPFLAPSPLLEGGPNPTKNVPTGAVRSSWLAAIGPFLANSVTEVTRSGPNELMVVRRSQLGFTGFELVMVSDWLTGARHLHVPPQAAARLGGKVPSPEAAHAGALPNRGAMPTKAAPVTSPKK